MKTQTKKPDEKAWWENFRFERWAELLEGPGPYSPETIKEVEFLERNVLTDKSARILDVACGSGRHVLELARRGFSVVGLDYSKELLERGREKAKEEKLSVTLIPGDMRELSFREQFDVVLNLFGSFGYFADPSDDKKTVENFARALKNDGKLFLDVRNPDWVFPRVRTGKNAVLPSEKVLSTGKTVKSAEGIDEETNQWIIRWEWPGGESDTVRVRLYNVGEMQAMLHDAGFAVERVFGSYDGEAFENDRSPRLMILARKTTQGISA